MRQMILVLAAMATLAATPARSFDPAGADIIGLRLGMTEPDVAGQLTRQGFAVTRAPGSIAANTMDGHLTASISPERGVTDIRYVFFGRGAGAPAKIREAIMVRFGDPDQADPPAWCREKSQDGTCPATDALLSFLPGSLTLRLTAAADKSAPAE